MCDHRKAPRDMRTAIAKLPAVLRGVVEEELAAGNEVVEVIVGHPAPPAGVGLRFLRPLSVPLASGVRPCRFPAWDGSSGYSDPSQQNFLLGPPAVLTAGSAMERFKQSLQMDYDKWRDGIGYDLNAIRDASPQERAWIQDLLLNRGVRDWRDIQALAILNTPRAREALRSALTSNCLELALAVARHGPHLVSDEVRTALMVRGLEQAKPFYGLTQTLMQVEDFHPAPVIDALFRNTVTREGDVAVHFAAMLMYLHGQAETSYDMDKRLFFLTFNTQCPTARKAAFCELCGKIGVNAQRYLESE